MSSTAAVSSSSVSVSSSSAVLQYYHHIKDLNVYTVLSLGLVAIVTLVPFNFPPWFRLLILGIVFAALAYVLHQTLSLSEAVRRQTPNLFVDDKQADLRTNVILSYLFCASLLVLLVYLLLTKVF